MHLTRTGPAGAAVRAVPTLAPAAPATAADRVVDHTRRARPGSAVTPAGQR
ncbi:hypothetical protein Q3W71_22575 [Micromonospora sp. C28SCA-DRY-2]|uniref:hypothetical protein n=1 Tax=Micromonospora sp. C28SCA-DRY-2 TaxID=3059522 RepID=UPI0026769894|nr:hypothetical protein [Micromonospora sp. C28SCA-DRY-2]MDO3704454.1 hypothetical protein [Micromonospora sp. C28SCA-DRY-2]